MMSADMSGRPSDGDKRPQPPPLHGGATEVAAGEVLYNRYCARCHFFGRGILPDLRRMDPATHGLFASIVLQGAYVPKGMGRFDDVLSPGDAEAVHAYLIDQAWQFKKATPAAPPP
jgi:quinohemoprotein ethanol dehydrogenase